MNRPAGSFCTAILLVLMCLPAAAQQKGQLKTRVLHNPNHTTIVIHDTRPEAYTRQREASDRAQQAREADAQRKHELELAKIQADAQVRVARAQNMVAQAPAPAPAPREEKKPSYRNGGRFTGFSDVYFGGFGWGGYGGGFYGGGYGGGYYGGGYGGGYRGNCAPVRCAPAYRGCR